MVQPVLGDALERARRHARGPYRRLTSQRRMLPTVLIIGAMKGGTSSLHDYLTQHPAVGAGIRKEVHYFTLNAECPVSWYRSQFPRQGAYLHACDSTPYYLFHPAAPRRARATVPEAKLIVLLRDPAERAYSHYNHARALGFEQLGFGDALEAEPARLAGEQARLLADPRYTSFSHQHHSYASRSLYGEQLGRWYAEFPAEQVLVLRSEDLFRHPASTVHRVQEWLGLAPHTPASLAPSNTRSYDPLDPVLRERLRAGFAADAQRVHTLTGVRLGSAPT